MVDDKVHSPSHYKHGKKETIDVIQDCMTDDEYHGYLKGNVLKYVSRYKFKGEPLQYLDNNLSISSMCCGCSPMPTELAK